MSTGWENKHILDAAYARAGELGFKFDRHPAYGMEKICLLVADENNEGGASALTQMLGLENADL